MWIQSRLKFFFILGGKIPNVFGKKTVGKPAYDPPKIFMGLKQCLPCVK